MWMKSLRQSAIGVIQRYSFFAGKQAVRDIKIYLNEKINFHQETTLAGKGILHTVKTAKEIGFSIHLWYIFVADTAIAKQRVHARVVSGGHGIPDEIIEHRNVTSLKTLHTIIPLCDEVWLFDNTTAYNPVARIINGDIKIFDKKIPLQILSCLE